MATLSARLSRAPRVSTATWVAVGPSVAGAASARARPGPSPPWQDQQPLGVGLLRLLDDHRGDHAEHPLLTLGVGEDVAVEDPDPRIGRLDQDRVALARGDVDADRGTGGPGRRSPTPRRTSLARPPTRGSAPASRRRGRPGRAVRAVQVVRRSRRPETSSGTMRIQAASPESSIAQLSSSSA